MNRITSSLIIGILLLTCCKGQEKAENSLEMTTLKSCMGKSIELTLPKEWAKTERFNYEEGFIQTYSYSDRSYVSVLCGANAQLDLPENYPIDKFSRKESVSGRTIIYANVTADRKNEFDNAFDKMKME